MSATVAPSGARSGAAEPAAQPQSEPRWPAFALLAAMAVGAAVLFHLTRGLTFFYDEWNFLMNRQAFTADALFAPHNEHNLVVTVLLFKGLWELVGLDGYWAFRVLVIALHLVCVGMLFLYARPRVGGPAALAAAVVVLFLGTAWEIILWPFEVQFLIPIAAGLGAFLLLDRRRRGGDLGASALLVLAFSSGSLGIPVTAGVTVEILFGPDRFRRLLRVVAVPVALYLVWLQEYDPFRARFGSYDSVPGFVLDQLGGAIAAIAGFQFSSAEAPAVIAALILTAVLLVSFARGDVDRGRLAAIVAMSLAYWSALALYRPWVADQEPSRYLYGGAVFVLLAVFELARGHRPRGPVLLIVGVLAAASVAANWGNMRDGAHLIRAYSDYVAPGLGALELARAEVAPGFRPEPNRAPDIVAGRYFDAVDRWGSPADSPEQILRRGEGPREAADIVLQQALRLRLAAPVPAAGPPPEAAAAPQGEATITGSCLRFEPAGGLSAIDLTLPPGGMRVAAGPEPVVIQLRRFGAGFLANGAVPGATTFANSRQAFGRELLSASTFQVQPGRTRTLRIPPDSAPTPWSARLSTAGRVTACGIGSA